MVGDVTRREDPLDVRPARAAVGQLLITVMMLNEIEFSINQQNKVQPSVTFTVSMLRRGVYDKSNDQKRTLSPKEAIETGSSYLVIGRPITQSEDPKRLIEEINTEIKSV